MLKAGDAAAITDQAQIAVRSKAPSEVLLFDSAPRRYQFSCRHHGGVEVDPVPQVAQPQILVGGMLVVVVVAERATR